MTKLEPEPRPETPTAPTPPEPFAPAEWQAAVAQPARLLELLFAQRERFGASVARGQELRLPAVLLLGSSVLTALPYGLVLSPQHGYRIALLFTGSLLLCWPSLCVFGSYVGCRLRPLQMLMLALSIGSIAGLFTFGFFPILWFLLATMRDGDLVTGHGASLALLAIALLAGLAWLLRCLDGTSELCSRGTRWLLLGWQVLVGFVTLRMARALELL
ncbi:MAG TPA: hypothetical protein VF384_07280 [Planctomycetota bacterium]